MKFRCERDELLEAVQFASRAISNRATLPVLSGLKIEASEGGEVSIAATDLELTMESAFRGGVDEPGRVIVPREDHVPGRLSGAAYRRPSRTGGRRSDRGRAGRIGGGVVTGDPQCITG